MDVVAIDARERVLMRHLMRLIVYALRLDLDVLGHVSTVLRSRVHAIWLERDELLLLFAVATETSTALDASVVAFCYLRFSLRWQTPKHLQWHLTVVLWPRLEVPWLCEVTERTVLVIHLGLGR
jgi:hypothetical protein